MSLFFNSNPYLLTICPACPDTTSNTTWQAEFPYHLPSNLFLVFSLSIYKPLLFLSYIWHFGTLAEFFTLFPFTFNNFQGLSFVITITLSHLIPFAVFLLSCGFWSYTFNHPSTYAPHTCKVFDKTGSHTLPSSSVPYLLWQALIYCQTCLYYPIPTFWLWKLYPISLAFKPNSCLRGVGL